MGNNGENHVFFFNELIYFYTYYWWAAKTWKCDKVKYSLKFPVILNLKCTDVLVRLVQSVAQINEYAKWNKEILFESL